MRPPSSRWWGTKSKWRNDRSARSEGSFGHAKRLRIPHKFCRLDWTRLDSIRFGSDSRNAKARPREGRATRETLPSRFLSLDAAGAVRYIDCRSGSPFSKWRGGVIRSKSRRLGAATTSRRGPRLGVSRESRESADYPFSLTR